MKLQASIGPSSAQLHFQVLRFDLSSRGDPAAKAAARLGRRGLSVNSRRVRVRDWVTLGQMLAQFYYTFRQDPSPIWATCNQKRVLLVINKMPRDLSWV